MGRQPDTQRTKRVLVDGKPVNEMQLEWMNGSIKDNRRLEAAKVALYRAEADLNGKLLMKTERDWRAVLNVAELDQVKTEVARIGLRLGVTVTNWGSAFSHEERD